MQKKKLAKGGVVEWWSSGVVEWWSGGVVEGEGPSELEWLGCGSGFWWSCFNQVGTVWERLVGCRAKAQWDLRPPGGAVACLGGRGSLRARVADW
ncbi:MAG: hypothetical protein LAT55_07395, partial [Opitutales bacterium]|nr:hypothetical protein [Opitutales bacterium]